MALRFVTAGESHGPGLTCIVEGLPAGLSARRGHAQPRHGPASAGPWSWRAHEDRARPRRRHRRRPPRPDARRPGRPADRQPRLRQLGRADEPWPVEADVPEVHLPRPGHADLVGTQKYDLTDVRNVLERASARETAARVAGGALARAFLRALGVEIRSHVIQIGSVRAPERAAAAGRRGLRARRRGPRPLPGQRGQPRDGRAHQRPAQGQRVARRRLRGHRLRARARPRLARLLGGAPRRQASPARCARSRRSRASGWGRASTSPASRAPRRTTRSSGRRSAATSARPTTPAASRAA